MKRICVLITLALLVTMAGCGSDSGLKRKQGEIYGDCYSDMTCNEGLVCDEDNNVCIKDEGLPGSNDSESIDVEADTESEDDDAEEISEQDHSEEIYNDTLPDDALCWEYRCKDGDSYCGYKESWQDENLKWGKIEDCLFSECIASTGKCGCDHSKEGTMRCGSDMLRICSDGIWQEREKCKGGCDKAIGQCKPWEDPASGLIWSSSSNALVWENAVDFCDNLTEGGFSDWRLPSINEARTLIIDCIETMIGGRCGVTDNCLSSDCLDYSCGLCEPQADGYYSKIDKHTDSKLFWSASEVSGSTVRAWGIELYTAGIAAKFKNEYGVTRCVRGENHRQLCEGLPEHAFWNSASNIFSTWDGTSWHPSLQGIYNDTASTKECRFKCVPGYKWDGYKCKLDDSFPECGVDSQTPCINSSTGLVWSSKAVDQSWKDAAVRCLRHSVGGSNIWRLPTIDELRRLVKNCPNAEYGGECAVSEEKGLLAGYESGTRESCFCYDTDKEYNKFGDSGFFWSSSIRSDDPENIWGIFMGYISYGAYGRIGVEIIDSLQTYEHGNVRCVVR